MFVTGGNGFIGRNRVSGLVARDHRVRSAHDPLVLRRGRDDGSALPHRVQAARNGRRKWIEGGHDLTRTTLEAHGVAGDGRRDDAGPGPG